MSSFQPIGLQDDMMAVFQLVNVLYAAYHEFE